ncbi:MAG: KEOPS complex kinase/ATPase Bud32 [Candidatus Pacearchaeota archaeon]
MERIKMEEKILQIGAEAIIIKKDSQIIKKRLKKSYRIPEIDERIRKKRTRSEGKILEKASKVISVPKIRKIDEKNKEIIMDFINEKRLSDYFDLLPIEKQKKICKEIGKNVGKLHDNDIIHGDLTTSNMILHKNKIFFIDFGLGFISHKIEDKAVDLHLFKEALEAKHFNNWKILYEEFLVGYKISKNSKKVIEQLKKVEKRGRYKQQY